MTRRNTIVPADLRKFCEFGGMTCPVSNQGENRTMPRLPTHEQNPNGFHQKYIISKANGEPVDPNAQYLVLRLDFDRPSTRTERLSARFAARSWAEDVLWSGSVRLRPVAEDVLKWLNETRGE